MRLRDKLCISMDKLDELRTEFSHYRVGKKPAALGDQPMVQCTCEFSTACGTSQWCGRVA